MEFAATLGLVREAVFGSECKSCPRLEALVASERNRANEYLRLLHETQSAHSELVDELLRKNGILKPLDDKVKVEIRHEPFGGFESPTMRARRLSEESFKKSQESKKQVETAKT